jgi:Tol biopolymer transport system component
MNPDGSSPTRLTDDKSRTEKLPSFVPVYDSSPVWSPDGTKIVFISNRNYLFSLYVMNADGSNARLVTDKVLEPAEPAWSPDGGKIAFSAGIRGTIGMTKPSADIYAVNVDGSGLTKLTQDSGLNSSPAWSPDGKQIAFTSNREAEGQSRIWLNADGGNQRILPNSQNDAGFYGGQPAWSPDGTKILFTAYQPCANQGAVSIFVTNADGGNSQLVTKNTNGESNGCAWYSWPRWSPDGTKILASLSLKTGTTLEPPPEIVVMNADGTNQIKISNRGKYVFNSLLSTFTDAHADWQPLPSPPDFASSVIGFSAPSFAGYEDAKRIPITVKRTGNLKDAASCLYVTVTPDLLIKHPEAGATGTVRFAPGESSKTISLPVVDYGGLLRTTSYKIVLSDNEGNATFIGGIKEAALTILGKDPASRKKNPK